MTVLDLLVLAEVLMRLMSRIIEIFLMIRDALQTRKGKERHSKPKPPKRSESRELALPAARPYYTKRPRFRKKGSWMMA